MNIGLFCKKNFPSGLIAVAFTACSPTMIKVEETHDIVSTIDKAETHAAVIPTEIAQTISTQPLEDSDRISLIWDDDGSPDGIISLLYFLSHPEVDMLAATVSYGEAHPAAFVDYVAAMLNYLNRPDIPVAAGRDAPLEGNNAFPDMLRDPTDDFWGISLPPAEPQPSSLSAAELIVQTISSSSEPVTVFVAGSFTNLAQAIRLDPTIKANIQAIECMADSQSLFFAKIIADLLRTPIQFY